MKSIRIVGKCCAVLVMFALAGPISLADEPSAKPRGTKDSFNKVKTMPLPESSRTLPRVGGKVLVDSGATTDIGLRTADDPRRGQRSLVRVEPRAADKELEWPVKDRLVTSTFEEVEILLDGTMGIEEIRALPQAPGTTCQELADPTRVVVQLPTEVVSRLRQLSASVRTLRRFVLIEAPSEGVSVPADNTRLGTCTGDYCYGQNGTNVNIPDDPEWVYSAIYITCAPAGSTVSCIDVHYEIDHTWVGNLDVDLTDADQLCEINLWGPWQGNDADLNETVTGINDCNGLQVNQPWLLWALDLMPGDEGHIDYWWIKVYYTGGGGDPCCDPPYSPGDRVHDFLGACGTVVCCDFGDPLPILVSLDGRTDLGGCEQCFWCDDGNCCQYPEGSYSWARCDQIEPGCDPPPPVCGDGVCEPPGETTSNCPADCCNPVCGNGVCECHCGETTANCPADCVDVPCDSGEYVPDLPCGSDYGRNREMCAATVVSCPCEPWCDSCSNGNCDPAWNGDGECDCGCQFCDIDCPEYPDCCISEPASAQVCVEVFPPECGSASCLTPSECNSVDPVCATSVWDPVLEKYIFCPIYTAGPCVGEVCVRLWIENEGPCDPELWWRFDQIGPGSVVSTDPPNCAIDARQPSNTNGTNPDGWKSIDIAFDCDASGLSDTDFAIEVPVGSVAVVPSVSHPFADTVTVEFGGIIPTGAWSRVIYNIDGTVINLGSLPGDVNGDGTSAPSDILRVIDCLNGVATCETWQCDVDRSGVCGPPDILRVIDLLNGAGVYDAWLNVPLTPCPSAP